MCSHKLNQGVQLYFRKIQVMIPPPKTNSWEQHTALTAIVKVRPKCLPFAYVMGRYLLLKRCPQDSNHSGRRFIQSFSFG
uniref:Uncharacterized protein n=1 Tax=Lepeophtheirus salmonis TaxID=72036 RepID=A0A0K2TQ96_LEPSM